jgi:hypothetical protein
MKLKIMATTVALLSSLFSWAKLPVVEGKLSLKEEEEEQLKSKFGAETSQQIIDAINKEIEQVSANEQDNEDLKKANDELAKVKAEVQKMLDDTNLSEEEKKALVEGKGEGNTDLTAQLTALKASQKKNDELLAKLMKDPEGDSPEAIIKRNAKNMTHSATHLFATGKQYDAFEKRAWNQRLRDGGIKATDFNEKGTVPLLQDDVEHFVRENPAALESMFNDFEDLPKEWDRRSGVLDRVADATIIAAEIVQGRKKGWAPKNKFKISPEEGRVFRKKIDITFDGYELQEIENTWIRSYNKEGSHPWKMSFVGFLLSELVKQQKLDDRKAQINGIFAQTPEGDGIAGAAVNSQDGLRYLWHHYRDIAKKYRPFSSSLGAPSKANIVDYIKEMIESIPEENRNQSGMEIQMSTEILKWYREKAGTIYQLHMSSDQGKMQYGYDHPIDYPNFKFQPLKDQNKTKFIAITASKNVQILDYNANEKGKFTVTHEKRDTNIFADYRLGIRLKFVGTELADGEPADFERQVVWSNDQPVFDSSVSVPVFDEGNGIVKVHYNHMKVDQAFVTEIVQVIEATPGQVLRITGNTSLAGAGNVKNNANSLLTADFDLKSGGTLTLFVQADGKVKELSRTTAPVSTSTQNGEFAGDTIDASLSTEFFYTGAASATLAEIINGADGKVIKIHGTDTAMVNFTVTNVAGNISVTADAVLATAADFIELVRVDGVWTEVSRTIAA